MTERECETTAFSYAVVLLLESNNQHGAHPDARLLVCFRFHPRVQSGSVPGGEDELWEGRQHPQVLHHLWPAGGLRAVRRQREPGRDHVAQQETASVRARPPQPPAHRGEPAEDELHLVLVRTSPELKTVSHSEAERLAFRSPGSMGRWSVVPA